MRICGPTRSRKLGRGQDLLNLPPFPLLWGRPSPRRFPPRPRTTRPAARVVVLGGPRAPERMESQDIGWINTDEPFCLRPECRFTPGSLKKRVG